MPKLLEDGTVEIEELALVANSGGIDLLAASGTFSAQIDALADQGAQFKVWGNSLWQSECEERVASRKRGGLLGSRRTRPTAGAGLNYIKP